MYRLWLLLESLQETVCPQAFCIFSLALPTFLQPMPLREARLSASLSSAVSLSPCLLSSGRAQLQAVGNPGVWPQVGLLVSLLTHSEHCWGTSCWAGPWPPASTGSSLPAGIHGLVGEADCLCLFRSALTAFSDLLPVTSALFLFLQYSREKVD